MKPISLSSVHAYKQQYNDRKRKAESDSGSEPEAKRKPQETQESNYYSVKIKYYIDTQSIIYHYIIASMLFNYNFFHVAEIPIHWEHNGEDIVVATADVPANSEEFKKVEDKFNQTMKHYYNY